MSQTKAQLVGGVGISTVGDLSVYGGVNATGVVTATSFYGGSATITGNVSIAGTLTYEDVTNVDSVGIITARSGINVTGGSVVVGSAVTLSSGGINVAGITTVTAGSASAPTISPSGDSNTGLFFPAADTIAFAEGGAESGRFNSSGNLLVGTTSDTGTASQKLQVTGGAYVSNNLGIGTINPDYAPTGGGAKLHVWGGQLWSTIRSKTASGDNVVLSTTESSNNMQLLIGHNTNIYWRLQVVEQGVGYKPLVLQLDGGNTGIGITNPSEKLHVVGNILASGNVTGYSDESLKDNVQTISDALDKVAQLRGVEYDRNDIEGNPHQIGVIAQEVEKIIPEVVTTHDDGIKSVAYGNLVGLLIEAIKDLKNEVTELKARLEEV